MSEGGRVEEFELPERDVTTRSDDVGIMETAGVDLSLVLPDAHTEPVGGRLGDRIDTQRQDFRIVTAVDRFYTDLKARGEVPEAFTMPSYDLFTLDEKGALCLKDGGERLTSVKKGPDMGKPLKVNTYELRRRLGLLGELSKKTTTTLEAAAKLDTAKDIEALVADRETMAELEKRGYAQAVREINGVYKEMQLTEKAKADLNAKIALINQEYDDKTSAVSTQIASRTRKAAEAAEGRNEGVRKLEEDRKQELVAKKAKLEAERAEKVQALKEKIADLEAREKTQLGRFRDSLNQLLNKNKPLRERLRTLFREQGITIVSLLTALGMLISTITLAVTGGGGAPSPTPPPGKGGVKEWAKQQLQALGRLLGKLAEKAAAALPGIIGSIVSWLLTTAEKAVGWLAENLWALVVAIAGMAYLTAKDYLVAKQLMTSRAPPKKD